MRKNLKQFRVIEKCMTMEQIANEIGCSRATYANVESGKRNGDLVLFWQRLQKAFDIDGVKLLKLQEKADN